MSTRLLLSTFVLLSIVSAGTWFATLPSETPTAQAQTAQDPRMIRPGEYPSQTIDRIVSSVYNNQYSINAKTSVDYALPMMEIHDKSQWWSISPLQMDLNADGLSDFVYSTVYSNQTQYVMLNTGNGFRMVYVCKYTPQNTNPQVYQASYGYQGDCAA